jgi:hypothetical protein
VIGVVVLLCCCLTILIAVGYTYLGRTTEQTFEEVQETLESQDAPDAQSFPDSLEYAGLADSLLKSDTLALIETYENSQGCSSVSLTTGVVTQYPDPNPGGVWQEMWTVDACGEAHVYEITFTPSPGGGTDMSVKKIN